MESYTWQPGARFSEDNCVTNGEILDISLLLEHLQGVSMTVIFTMSFDWMNRLIKVRFRPKHVWYSVKMLLQVEAKLRKFHSYRRVYHRKTQHLFIYSNKYLITIFFQTLSNFKSSLEYRLVFPVITDYPCNLSKSRHILQRLTDDLRSTYPGLAWMDWSVCVLKSVKKVSVLINY